ncbi:hypothetical protein ACFOWM_09955 [Ferruginibacter yonginensis]|uniref:CPBP family intramembrane metalloprotease n=1 Tax=Ferruginibacter yonginensis TaxID=1310416 RepID=A0ABV8QTJ7_9BACT
MEDNTKLFLVTIMQTVSLLILWLLLNILFGLYLKYGLFENQPSATNIIYYIIFITGSIFLIRYIKSKWKKVGL